MKVLRGYRELDACTLEYMTALLMNLVTRVEGRRACLDPSLESLSVLAALMVNMETRTYVNGAMYSLLSLPEFKAEAKASLCLTVGNAAVRILD